MKGMHQDGKQVECHSSIQGRCKGHRLEAGLEPLVRSLVTESVDQDGKLTARSGLSR